MKMYLPETVVRVCAHKQSRLETTRNMSPSRSAHPSSQVMMQTLMGKNEVTPPGYSIRAPPSKCVKKKKRLITPEMLPAGLHSRTRPRLLSVSRFAKCKTVEMQYYIFTRCRVLSTDNSYTGSVRRLPVSILCSPLFVYPISQNFGLDLAGQGARFVGLALPVAVSGPSVVLEMAQPV